MTPKQRTAIALTIATAIAVPAEGLRQRWYADPVGITTVCYGHTGDVDKRKTYTLPECKALLSTDMLNALATVERCQPGLPVNVLAAFGDAVYNIGPKVACDQKNSTAARMLAAKDYPRACLQLPRWNQGKVMGVMVALPGLTKRRAREMGICLGVTQ